MIMFYEGCTIDEIIAYRELENETFDFGEGKMKMEGLLGSEDAYYEMCIPNESCYINYDKFEFNYNTDQYEYIYHEPKSKKKIRLTQYYKKQIDQNKMNKLRKYGWWIVSDKGLYKKRCYYSERKFIAKRITNKKIRKYKGEIGNGNCYRKIYDYWWNVF